MGHWHQQRALAGPSGCQGTWNTSLQQGVSGCLVVERKGPLNGKVTFFDQDEPDGKTDSFPQDEESKGPASTGLKRGSGSKTAHSCREGAGFRELVQRTQKMVAVEKRPHLWIGCLETERVGQRGRR